MTTPSESATQPERSSDAALPVQIASSRGFSGWMQQQQVSFAFSTYQMGKAFIVGLNENGQLSVTERTFPRCMGMATSNQGQTLWLSSLYQVWRLENFLDPGQLHGGYDRLYVPQASWVTGDVDIHDMVIAPDGRPIFVNTLFSCLSRLSEDRSFEVIWKPPFISKLAAEDRCHLNGLASDGGVPRFVTAVSRSDSPAGWRERRRDGGVVMDVASGEVVCARLSMPHSPRLYQGKLYVLNSGTGEFGWIDTDQGRFEPMTFCPGYLRGLAFAGNYALVGLSKPRHDGTFDSLPLQEALAQRDAEPRCGVMVIDLTTGDAVEWLTLSGMVVELYDVVTLPGVRRPTIIGTIGEDIRRILRFDRPERAPSAVPQ